MYWNDLKSALRYRHIASYYHHELLDKLHRLNQRNMSVEEYRKKMELYMMRARIREDETVILAHFMSGLSLEIRDKVELLPYRDFHDLVQICMKIEQQILRKGPGIISYPDSFPKKDLKREGKFVKEKPKENPSKAIVQDSFNKRDNHIASNRTSDIKCFKCLGCGHVNSQCPSMRTILIKAQDVYSSEEESIEDSTSKEFECDE